jgi:hypothetical protein
LPEAECRIGLFSTNVALRFFGVASVTLESAGRLLAIALLGDAAKPKSKCLEG